MGFSKNEVVKCVYDASVTTLGAVAIGVTAKKLLRTDLGVPMTGYGIM